MDRKEKKGNPFEGPMKRIEPPVALPAPPDISTIIEEPKQEEKPTQEAKEDRGLCPCGYPQELCVRFNGNPLAIALYMAGARVVTISEEP